MNRTSKIRATFIMLLMIMSMILGISRPAAARNANAAALQAGNAAVTSTGKVTMSLTKSKKNKKNNKNNNNNNNKNNNKNNNNNSSNSNSGNSSSASSKNQSGSKTNDKETESSIIVEEDGQYTGKEEVAAYLHEFGHLPDNYITKNKAKKLGWDSSSGNLDEVAPGKSIGGDHFGNYEELLPVDDDREYFECDIDYNGGYRGSKRIIYSNDGLIYYTEDHYKTFTQLY